MTRPARSVAFEHDGVQAMVGVRVSARATRVRLLVHPDGTPEVVVPSRARGVDPHELVAANASWLAGHVRRRRERSAAASALLVERPGHLPLQGGWLPVAARAGPVGAMRTRISLRAGFVEVAGPVEGPAARAALERWYREQARAASSELVSSEGARLGLRASSIAIRDQRTRWASCSRAGALSFSWRLVLAPPEALRYVVVHELCHLAEPNHGPGFWALVDEALPRWREARAWLVRNGEGLHAWRPAFPGSLDGPGGR